jgi:hypothetical protein
MPTTTQRFNYLGIFNDAAPQAVPAAQPPAAQIHYVHLPPPPPVAPPPQVTTPALTNEAFAELARRLIPASPPATPEAGQAKRDELTNKERLTAIEGMLREEQQARKAAEAKTAEADAKAAIAQLETLRTHVISAARQQGLAPVFDVYVTGTNQAELMASAAQALQYQAQHEQMVLQRNVQQFGAPAPVVVSAPGVPVGMTYAPPQINAPSMISAPAPVQSSPFIQPGALEQLTSHEAMRSGAYGQNRQALLAGVMGGHQQPSQTTYHAMPAPAQYQPQNMQSARPAMVPAYQPQYIPPTPMQAPIQYQPPMQQQMSFIQPQQQQYAQPQNDAQQAAMQALARMRDPNTGAPTQAFQSAIGQGLLL